MLPEAYHYLTYKRTGTRVRLCDIYGTEAFCWFLYGLVLVEKPRVVLELGTGAGCTACLAGLAVKANGIGHVWTVDSGEDWDELRPWCQAAAGYQGEHRRETHLNFIKKLLTKFGVQRNVSAVCKRMSPTDYFTPRRRIDLLFADVMDTGPLGCLDVLRYYLPKMSRPSSIFIDRASTILPSRLLLRDAVGALNAGKIPKCLRAGAGGADVRSLERLTATSRFSVIDLVDAADGKLNKRQNSRAWIRIEDVDCFASGRGLHFMDGGSTEAIRLPRPLRP